MKRCGKCRRRKQYNKLLQEQNGLCAICFTRSQVRLAIDHDHVTGEIRGLLCHACNLLLGNAKDQIRILQRAIAYLQKIRKVTLS